MRKVMVGDREVWWHSHHGGQGQLCVSAAMGGAACWRRDKRVLLSQYDAFYLLAYSTEPTTVCPCSKCVGKEGFLSIEATIYSSDPKLFHTGITLELVPSLEIGLGALVQLSPVFQELYDECRLGMI